MFFSFMKETKGFKIPVHNNKKKCIKLNSNRSDYIWETNIKLKTLFGTTC